MIMIKISYLLSEKGRKSSLIAGGTGKRLQEVEVLPRCTPLFPMFVELVKINFDGSGSESLCGMGEFDDVLTFEQMLEKLREKRRLEAEQEAAEAAKKAEREAERLREIERIRAAGPETLITYAQDGWPSVRGTYPELIDVENAALAIANDCRLKIIAEREAAEAAKKAEKEAKKECLRQWAIENGSPLLKARIENGFDWQQLAAQEWADKALAPINFLTRADELDDEYDDVDVEYRTLPNMDEIRAYTKAKSLLGDNALVTLHWVTYNGEDDDYSGESSKIARTEIKISVVAPDGTAIERFYKL